MERVTRTKMDQTRLNRIKQAQMGLNQIDLENLDQSEPNF